MRHCVEEGAVSVLGSKASSVEERLSVEEGLIRIDELPEFVV